MSALLYQRISTDDLRKIMNAYDNWHGKYCTWAVDCPHGEYKCMEHHRQAFLEAFDKGEINFE